MTRKKSPFQDTAKEIDIGLGGLFDALTDAIGEIASRLDEDKLGTVSRDHTFETSKGPIRAQAGLRIRMAGADSSIDATPAPKSVNTPKKRATPSAPATRPLSYEVLEDGDAWVLTADCPGVARKDVTFNTTGSILHIRTTGARKYAGEADLGAAFAVDDIQMSLRNGILTLRIPKGSDQ